MSNQIDSATPELQELNQIVAQATAKAASARDLVARKADAQAALDHARLRLIEDPSPATADEYTEAWGYVQSAGAVAKALEEGEATNEKHVIEKLLGTERGFALFASAWKQRASNLEALRRTVIVRLADARHLVSARGELNPLVIEHDASVSTFRDAVNRIDGLLAEARFRQRYCEALGNGHEWLDLLAMTNQLLSPLPVIP